MRRAATSYDESDVRVRPARAVGRGRKPVRHMMMQPEAMVVSVDRGRWGCVIGGDPTAGWWRCGHAGWAEHRWSWAIRSASSATRRPQDTLARIVKVADRSTVLRHRDDTDPYERIVAAMPINC